MPNITMAQAKIKFLESIEPSYSPNTLQTYRKALETFINMLETRQVDSGIFPVAELTEDYIIYFIKYMKDLSPATEALYVQVIKSFFQFLDAEEWTKVNLSRVRMLIRQHSRQSRREIPEYPEKEINRLLQFMNDLATPSQVAQGKPPNLELRLLRDRALIFTLADTGLRPDELCKLRCGDIDWIARQAVLKGRGNKQAIIRFSGRAIDAIKDYLSARQVLDLETRQIQSSLPLFARHDKGAGKRMRTVTPTTIRRIVAERVDQILGPEATGRITPHTFLHYFVTTILRATGNLKLAQVLARHASIQITQRYAHIDDKEIDRDYYEIFEKTRRKQD